MAETTQLGALNEINRALQQQLDSLNTISLQLGNQASVTRELAGASQEAGRALDQQAESTSILDKITKSLEDTWTKFTNKLTSWIPQSVKNGFSLLTTNISSFISVITGGQASVQGFFASIYNFFVKKAAELAQDMIRFSEALENVRDKFGDLNENTSRQVVSSARALSGGLREASNSSKAFAGKFGIGIDAGIAKLAKMSEIAGDLGATFDTLSSDGFEKASTQLYVLKDGLAFTSEGLQATNRLAMISGESLGSFSEHIMASVDKIGKHFGMSTKVLGGDVGKALSNFKMLGKMTGDYVKEITKAAVFTRKLGIELTSLTGLVDKFDDFESGAEAAAQLAQGFGLVVDPLKMMGMEVGPRLAELQKGFIATGRSIDSMTRQERALLASTSGLSDEQVQLAFSQKGLSMSYDDISKGANEAAEKQKSSQEVMVDLAKNIKNILQPLLAFDGFVTAFFAGISKGFGSTAGFMKIIGKLADQLIRVYEIGGQTGRILADALFPPGSEKDQNSAFTFFTNIGEMFISISGYVRDFVGLLTSGGDVSASVSGFFEKVFDKIDETFSKSTSGFDVVDFSIKFGTKIVQVFTGAIQFFIKQIPKWTAGLKGMFSPGSSSNPITAGFFSAFDSLKAELPNLKPVLYDFGNELVDAIFRFFKEYPFVSKISAFFLAGGPIMTIFADIGYKLLSIIPNLIGAGAAKASTSGAGAAGAAKIAGAVSTGALEPAVPLIIAESSSWFDKFFDIVKDPLKVAAMGAGVAILIKTIGEAIQEVLFSFMEKTGKHKKSFVESIADAAKLFEKVSAGDLISLGTVFGSVFGALALTIGALAAGAAQIGTIGTIGILFASSFFSIGPSPGSITKALTVISSAVADIADAFGDPTFVKNLNAVLGMSARFPALIDVSSSIEKVIKGVTAISDAIPKKGWGGSGGQDIDSLKTTIKGAVNMLKGTGTTEDPGIIAMLAGLPNASALTKIDLSAAGPILSSLAGIIETVAGFENTDDAKTYIDKLLKDRSFSVSLQMLMSGLALVPTIATTGIASAVTALSNVNAMIKAISEFGDPGAAVDKLNGLTNSEDTTKSSFVVALSTFFKQGLAPLLTATAPKNLGSFKESIIDIASIITELNKIKNLNGATDTLLTLINGTAASAGNTVGYGATEAKPSLINSLVTFAIKINSMPALKKPTGLNPIFGALIDVNSIISELNKMTALTKAVDNLKSINTKDTGFMHYLFEFAHLKLRGFKTLVIPDLTSLATAVTAITDIAKDIGGVPVDTISNANKSILKLMNGGTAKADRPGSENSFLTNLSALMTALNEQFDTGGDTSDTTAADLIQKLADTKSVTAAVMEVVTDLSDVVSTESASANVVALSKFFPDLRDMMSTATTNLTTMSALTPEEVSGITYDIGNMFDVIESYTGRVEGISTLLADQTLQQFEGRIYALKDHVGILQSILADLGTIDLQGTITDVEANMKVGQSVMTINGGAVVVTVNMTVNMNAKTMSAALVMDGYIEPQQEFGDYLMNKNGSVDDVFNNATNSRREYLFGKDVQDVTGKTFNP